MNPPSSHRSRSTPRWRMLRENILGERGYGDTHAWMAAWDARVAKGVLTAPAPTFLSATVEHGKLPNGVA